MTLEQPGLDEDIRHKMIEVRRSVHEHPELSNREFNTSALVRRELGAAGMAGILEVAGTGLIVDIEGTGTGNGKTIAIRADLDALPVTENTGLPFASKNRGIMHACGHDAHIAMVLAAALSLHHDRYRFGGSVRCIFQPAEEAEPLGGRTVVQDGHLAKVDGVIGIHVDPEIESGKVGVRAGVFAFSSDEFDIQVIGKSSHGAKPHDGVDAIIIAAGLLQELQKITARQVDPDIPLVITVGVIEGGTARNIIADRVLMKGTIRTTCEATRALAQQRVRDLAEGLARAHGGNAEVEIRLGEPVLVNDEGMVELVRRAVIDVAGPENFFAADRWTASDDFAFYSQLRPSVYFRLGVRNEARGLVHGLHQDEFTVDEDAMTIGASVLIRAAQRFLTG